MTPTEAATLACYIGAHFPQQPIDEFTGDALGELLADYPFSDARQAVLNIAQRGERWCAPSDVRAEVKRIRGKRIAEHPPVEPPPNLDTSQYAAWLADTRKRIGDGDQIDSNAYAGELVSRPAAIEAAIAKLRADLTAEQPPDEHPAAINPGPHQAGVSSSQEDHA